MESDLSPLAVSLALVVGGVFATYTAYYVLRKKPTTSKNYKANISHAYDTWSTDGVLEHFWGEHIHHGYYGLDEADKKATNFEVASVIKASAKPQTAYIAHKLVLINKLLSFAKVDAAKFKRPARILDVGCGIGGTTRILQRKFPNAKVTGITLSPLQKARAAELDPTTDIQVSTSCYWDGFSSHHFHCAAGGGRNGHAF